MRHIKTFRSVDQETSQVLRNNYIQDFDEPTFIGIQGNTIKARLLRQLQIDKHEKLSEIAYYNYSVIFQKNDNRINLPYQNFTVPNFSQCFASTGDRVSMYEKDHKKISPVEYEELLYRTLLNKFLKYKNLGDIKLAYSGGIDSLVLLSFMFKTGLMDQVQLVKFINRLTGMKNTGLDIEKKLGLDVTEIVFDNSHVITAVNTGNFYYALNYTSYNMMSRFPKSNLFFGYHGNQSLLHKSIFLEQIKKAPTIKGYCKSMHDYKIGTNPVPLQYHRLVWKPWRKLDGIFGSRMFDPLGDNEIFSMTRRMDWSMLCPNYIADATLARNLIRRNVGNKFDDLIVHENMAESDSIVGDFMFDIADINQENLNIIDSQRHNVDGLAFLKATLKKAKAQRLISYHTLLTLLSIKELVKN